MMESVPTVETVYQGVHAMYNTANASERQKATKWIEQFQNSVSGDNDFLEKNKIIKQNSTKGKKKVNRLLT